MKKCLSYLRLSVLIFALPVLFSCGGDDDDNPIIDLSDPSTFPGTYVMVELTDKTGGLSGIPNLTVESGEPVTVPYPIGGGQTVSASVTITHTLVLTQTTYSTVFNIVVSVPGIPVPPINTAHTGTYTLTGNQLTTTESTGDVEVNTVSVSNGQLIFENSELKIVYEKQ